MQSHSAMHSSLWQNRSSLGTARSLYSQRHKRTKSSTENLSRAELSKGSTRSFSWLAKVGSQRPDSPAFIRSIGNNNQGNASPPRPVDKNEHRQILNTSSRYNLGGCDDSSIRKRCPLTVFEPESSRDGEQKVEGQVRQKQGHYLQHQNGMIRDAAPDNKKHVKRMARLNACSRNAKLPGGYIERPITTDDSNEMHWQKSVYILIGETEQAFQAVHDSLQHDLDDLDMQPSWLSGPPRCRVSPSTTSGLCTDSVHSQVAAQDGRQPLSPRFSGSQRIATVNKPLPPNPKGRDEEAKQGKDSRKTAKIRKEMPIKDSSMSKGLQRKKPSRWTLPVTQILRCTRFMRVEADEMLTPKQIKEICDQRLRKQQEKEDATEGGRQSGESNDSQWSKSSSTSTSVSTHDHVLAPATYPVTSPIDHAVVHKDFSVPKLHLTECDSGGTLFVGQQQRQQSAEQLNPPPRNPERNTKRLERLPTIPEADSDKSDEHGEQGGRASQDDDLLIQLSQTRATSSDVIHYNTSHSQSQPSHVTGRRDEPFRLKHESLCGQGQGQDQDQDQDQDQAMKCQEDVDGGPRRALHEADDDVIANEMAVWFQAFGFESHGQLIHDGVPSKGEGDSTAMSVTSSCDYTSGQSDASTNPSTVGIEEEEEEENNGDFQHQQPMRFFTSGRPPRMWKLEGPSSQF